MPCSARVRVPVQPASRRRRTSASRARAVLAGRARRRPAAAAASRDRSARSRRAPAEVGAVDVRWAIRARSAAATFRDREVDGRAGRSVERRRGQDGQPVELARRTTRRAPGPALPGQLVEASGRPPSLRSPSASNAAAPAGSTKSRVVERSANSYPVVPVDSANDGGSVSSRARGSSRRPRRRGHPGGPARVGPQPVEVAGRVGQPVDVVDPQPGHAAVGGQLRAGAGAWLVVDGPILDPHADQAVDVEESPVVALECAGAASRPRPVVLARRAPSRPRGALRRPRPWPGRAGSAPAPRSSSSWSGSTRNLPRAAPARRAGRPSVATSTLPSPAAQSMSKTAACTERSAERAARPTTTGWPVRRPCGWAQCR